LLFSSRQYDPIFARFVGSFMIVRIFFVVCMAV